MSDSAMPQQPIRNVFLIFLKLGLTAFGGPVAHLGYFRDEFVVRRQWLDEQSYADLVALCQFLPGPASSQVGLAIGWRQAGYRGALAAWAGFTLPSALALILLAFSLNSRLFSLPETFWHGLKIAAVAVVAQAVWGMGKSLCTDTRRLSLMILAACWILLMPTAWAQVTAIAAAGAAGLLLFPHEAAVSAAPRRTAPGSRAWLWLAGWLALLLLLPLAAALSGSQTLALFDAFYRTGSLVFGGGHVVLPLLQLETVGRHWLDNSAFLAGYGAAQAVPGPLFTFAAFLGAAMQPEPNGWTGGLIALVAIFLPSFLLVFGALPFWESLRRKPRIRSALAGINAAVVGLLLATLYHPVWTASVAAPGDFAGALLAFAALVFWKQPPWLVVIGCGLLFALLG